MTTVRRTRVIKVGGSLFDDPHLVSALRLFVERQSPAAHILIAGGGPWADAIRDADDRFRIGEETAHRLCIRAMGVTARLLATLVPQWPLEKSWDRLRTWAERPDSQGDARVLDVKSFLADVEPQVPGEAIPHDWTATSDSISARIAQAFNATELVLLKSAAITGESSIEGAAEEGYVDRFFPRAAQGLRRIRCVNLRDPESEGAFWEIR
jgi:aspartokinase-like uncharacterized kinase